MLPRLQLFEFCDQAWLPQVLRDSFNDAIGFSHRLYRPYQRAAVPISQWAKNGQAAAIQDFASAGGEHILELVSQARREGVALPKIILSDLFPVPQAWDVTIGKAGGEAVVSATPTPLSVTNPPPGLPRYWSIFSAFHHFPPEVARGFLKQFTEHADGLCIAEFFHRSWYSVLMTVLAIPTSFLIPFFARKPTLAKVFLSCVIPVVPLMYLFDGIVSVLRTYRAEEIIAMLPEESRDQFQVEHQALWYGLAPMKSQLVFITRKNAVVPSGNAGNSA